MALHTPGPLYLRVHADGVSHLEIGALIDENMTDALVCLMTGIRDWLTTAGSVLASRDDEIDVLLAESMTLTASRSIVGIKLHGILGKALDPEHARKRSFKAVLERMASEPPRRTTAFPDLKHRPLLDRDVWRAIRR